MIGQTSRYAEIVIKVTPARLSALGQAQSPSGQGSPYQEAKQSYDVLVYADLPLPMIKTPRRPPPGQPEAVAGLRLAGVEHIRVRWSHYREYLAAFVEGAKGTDLMRERLVETMSSGLGELFYGAPFTPQTVRLWWWSDTPELDDLPWELLTQPGRNYPPEKFLFVRGLPPEAPVPILPLPDRLRLALIYDPAYTPEALSRALMPAHPAIEVIPMPEHPRKSLERVVSEGHELLHVVADGVVSSAYEGSLYFHGGRSTSPELTARELSATLRGSRVTVLGLTGQEYSDPDTMTVGDWQVPSVYRAFTYLGGSRLPMPSVVAPLGPLTPDDLHLFWEQFYGGLAETLSLHRAMSRAHKSVGPVPVALFLRHPHPVLFRRVSGDQPPEVSPSQLVADHQLSQELVAQLKANSDLYGGAPESVSAFIEGESARQELLSTALDTWVTPSEEEQREEGEGEGEVPGDA